MIMLLLELGLPIHYFSPSTHCKSIMLSESNTAPVDSYFEALFNIFYMPDLY